MTQNETGKNTSIVDTDDVFYHVLSTANMLEAIQRNLYSVIDFFATSSIVKLQAKLSHECLRLFSKHSERFRLDQYRKAEELVWKRLYHDIYRFQRGCRHRIKKQDDFLLETHFVSGIGFYSHLIVQLRVRYKLLSVSGLPEPLNLTLGTLDTFSKYGKINQVIDDKSDVTTVTEDLKALDSSETQIDLAREWARQAIYRSLIYMGDLARYLIEISQGNYRILSYHLYRSAALYQPDHGLPFNQLANLSGGINHSLGAITNFMRSALKKKPFDSAEVNMKKIFELNDKHYKELNRTQIILKASDVLSSKNPGLAAESMLRITVIRFIKLSSDIWEATYKDPDQACFKSISEEIVNFFEVLREALDLEPIVPLANVVRHEERFQPISGIYAPSDKPRYVTPTIMYEFCSVSMMLLAKARRKYNNPQVCPNASEDAVINAINIIALNLLHYSTSKCQRMIMSKVHELRVRRQEVIDKVSGNNQKSELNSRWDASSDSLRSLEILNSTSESANKKTLSRLKQRKAAMNYSSHWRPKAIILHSEEMDISELEETALSTIDALDIGSDISNSSKEQHEDLIDLGSSSSDDTSLVRVRDRSNSLSRTDLAVQRPRLFIRSTRSQNYEREKNPGVSNSSAIPDLLTGEVQNDYVSKSTITSKSSVNSSCDSDTQEHENFLELESSPSEPSIYESALAHLYLNTYLPSIKILCDWLLSNGDIIGSNLQSFCSFYSELNDLVSMMNELKKVADSLESVQSTISDRCGDTYKHSFDGSEWRQKFPLSCDFPLVGLDPLKNVHDLNVDFSYSRELNDSEAGFITVQCISAFFHTLRIFLENKQFQSP